MRIFISHGTDKARPRDLEFLDRLDGLLGAPVAGGGPLHEVLLDRTRIGAGDDWEGLLHDVLAECQAAILLLSQRALTRPWVLKESTILSYRKAREPGFPFFCVVLPDVTVGDLAAVPAFAALNLDATQAFAPGTGAEAVADWVLQRLAALTPPETTPLDRLERAVEAQLAHVDAHELETLCEALLGEPVPWMASAGRARQRARMLARGIVRGRVAGVGGLAGLTKALKTAALGRESREAVLKLAAPSWIDAEAAGRFASLLSAPPDAEPFAAALNGVRIRFSPRMLAWRALLPDTSNFVYWVEGGGSDAWEDELVARIRRAYRKGREDLIDSDEEVDEVLAARTEPIVYVLPPPVPDAALLRSLRRRYPRVSFIVHTGAELPPADELPEVVVPLLPALQVEVEKIRHADYTTALEALP